MLFYNSVKHRLLHKSVQIVKYQIVNFIKKYIFYENIEYEFN